MEFSRFTLATVSEVDESVAATPWARRAIRIALRSGIVGTHKVVQSRPPSGFWEWFLSWFGFDYEEVIENYHLDFLYVLFWLLLVVLTIVASVAVARMMVHAVRLFSSWVIFRLATISERGASLLTRVFRVLASSLEPGENLRAVVPNATVVPYFTESIRSGSAITKYALPDSQVTLGNFDGDRFIVAGCGVRIGVQERDEVFIVTAKHVYDGLGDDFAIRGKKSTIRVSKTSSPLGDGSKDRLVVPIDTDVLAFAISASEASNIGVCKATIGRQLPIGGSLAIIVGPSGEGSVGPLSPDASVFGQVVYQGSTIAGFSGAGYFIGTTLYGIHCAGGSRNVGYSMRLAYVTLLHNLKVKQEDSDEWLRDIITRKKKKVKVDLTWGALDSKRIQVDGEYHIVDVGTWQEVVGNLAVSQTGSLQYDDSERVLQSATESKNSKAMRSARASSSSTELDPDIHQQLLNSIKELKAAFVSQQKGTANSPQSSKSRKKASAGQGEAQAPSSQSEST